MMNCPLVSIIVPVYQVEKYLEKCLGSIIGQTYGNLEIILVDDGSTDHGPAICDRFRSEDSRIQVIHQANGGLSHARNVGLAAATGDFIGFVDSDDWIEPQMIDALMSALQETGADIAVCGRQVEEEGAQSSPDNADVPPGQLYSAEEALKMMIQEGALIRNAVWDKLYRRSVISNITFPEGKIYEDLLWSPLVMGNAKAIVYVGCPLYHYLQRPESLSHHEDMAVQRGLDKIDMLRRRLAYIREHYPSLEQLTTLKFQNACCREYVKISLHFRLLDADGGIRHELHRQFCQSRPFNLLEYNGFRMTFGQMLFRFSPWLLVGIYAICEKICLLETTLRDMMGKSS